MHKNVKFCAASSVYSQQKKKHISISKRLEIKRKEIEFI